jgi:DHA3 family macrolide efflux protein-like MFS transporter
MTASDHPDPGAAPGAAPGADPRMKTFFVLWIGQLLSMLGSALTGFGLSVWIYRRTGSATQFAMNSLLMVVTGLVLGQVAGALADRWDRRRTLLGSDIGMAANTLVLAVLLFLDRLEVWHVYAVTVSGAVFNSFRWPAMNGIIVQITPPSQLTRANGLVMAGETTSTIAAPLLAGSLMAFVGLPGLLVIDTVTFIAFVAILIGLPIPRYERPATEGARKPSLLHDVAEGWAFVYRRAGLTGLLIFSAVTNFFLGIIEVLFIPLVLGLGSVALLGWSSSIASAGMLVGSLVMTAWGGPTRRVRFFFLMVAVQGVLAIVVGIRPMIPLIMVGAFGYMFLFPLIGAAQQTIWQTRVPHHMQGRIAAVRGTISNAAVPLALVIAGPLADYVFKPLLAVGGRLDGTLAADLLGVGSDRGIGLLIVVMGLLSIVGAALAYLHPRIRHLEQELHVFIEEQPPQQAPSASSSLAAS